jgi:DNA-directed RNA polymerase subunit RPC12/RpoP
MYGNCLKCKEDVGHLMTYDTLCAEFIECPKCGNKMVVDYEEYWDEETDEEETWWGLEPYEEI